MNPIDTDPRVTAEMMAEGKEKLALLGNSIKTAVSLALGDDFSFVVIMRHKTQAKTMLVLADVDSQEETTSIITEAYERHNQSDMNRFSDAELHAPVNQH